MDFRIAGTFTDTINRMLAQSAVFSQHLAAYPIRRATVQRVKAAINRCSSLLMNA